LRSESTFSCAVSERPALHEDPFLREIIQQIREWQAAGEQVAVATVTRVIGSAPRPVGARLAISSSGAFAGSVSGGCVEGAVIQEAALTLREGRPRLLHFGISEEMSWEVGLACGGAIDVLVQEARPAIWNRVAELVARNEPCVLLTLVSGGAMGTQAVVTAKGFPGDFPHPGAAAMAQEALAGAAPGARLVADAVLVEPFFGPAHLIVFGGVHAAIPLTQMAQLLGFRVTVVDPRSRFANRERFPRADRVLVAWPAEAMAELAVDGRSAIVILTHDPKIDEPALLSALESQAFYVGAIGSRKTHAARRQRLAALGVPAEKLARIHGPIGLDLGGGSPEEMALAILAELIAVRHGRAAGFLSRTD
jgi:xanthine dehydrogenase accessory factor